MDRAQHAKIVSFLWGIADDVLRDVYVRGKYRDVILPMVVVRRLDAVLAPTRDRVRAQQQSLFDAGIAGAAQADALAAAAGQPFYNTSPFTLSRLLDDPGNLRQNFEAYLDGFSPNVAEIVGKFKFRNQLATLEEADVLGAFIEKFTDPDVNLGPDPVPDERGNPRLPGLSNHGMGLVFEELIRRFNEENNEEAGERFTPREVVRLMARLLLEPVGDALKSGAYRLYDGACGTGGMLTVGEETLNELAVAKGVRAQVRLYGQESQGETYAICKADLLLKGEGDEAEHIKFGSTLSADALGGSTFDFMLSNPPYGKSWKTGLDKLGGKKDFADPRFVVTHAPPGKDPEELSLVTRSSDGQLLFLANKLAKMKGPDSPLGSRIAHVHNGSSLFTGDAGGGGATSAGGRSRTTGSKRSSRCRSTSFITPASPPTSGC